MKTTNQKSQWEDEFKEIWNKVLITLDAKERRKSDIESFIQNQILLAEKRGEEETIKRLTFNNYYIPPHIMKLFHKEIEKQKKNAVKQAFSKLELEKVKISELSSEEFYKDKELFEIKKFEQTIREGWNERTDNIKEQIKKILK